MIDIHSRRSKRITRARLDLELSRARGPLAWIVAGALVGLGITGYIASKISPTFLSSSHTVRIAVRDATGVNPGRQELRFKGLPVGVIKKIQLVDGHPVLTAQYKAKYGQLYRDARLELRPATPLMDMYVDVLDRGTPDAGKLEGDQPLPASQTDVAVNVDEVLNIFRADARTRMSQLLDNLGNGLADHGARLRESLVELTPLVNAAGRITDQIAARDTMTKRLVHNTGQLMAALGDRDKDLRTLVDQGASALSALQQGAPDLAATIAALPPTLRQLDTSFAAVRGALPDVNNAVQALRPVSTQVSAALTALASLNHSAAPAVRALHRPIDKLVPLSAALLPVAQDLQRSLPILHRQIPPVSRTVNDLVTCKKGIEMFFQGTASLGKFGDARGPVPRGNLAAGVQSLSIPSPDEFALPQCVPGKPISGRVPTVKDFH
jgi:virulence factor Mce-like protein